MCVILSEPTAVVPLPYFASPLRPLNPSLFPAKKINNNNTDIYIYIHIVLYSRQTGGPLTRVGAMASKHNARDDYVNIGAGRPPVSLRLAQRIESGVFIEMADLLPECLGDK